MLGQVDYRLQRDATIRLYRRGRVARIDICDAQPELLRAARHLSRSTAVPCPICEEEEVVYVTYAFGRGIPACGRVVGAPSELERLRRRVEVRCYLVEVCPSCGWNHLLSAFGARPGS
jgi:ribosomal protein S27E